MKITMNNTTFKKICRAFADFADERENPYTYLYENINGFPYGTRSKNIILKNIKLLMDLDTIKACWDDTNLYYRVARLAVYVHYNGSKIEIKPNDWWAINDDFIRAEAYAIKKKVNKVYEEDVA